MPNNLAVGPNAVVAKSAISFVDAGHTSINTAIIYKIGNPNQSYVPGRSINAITAYEVGVGYYVVMLSAVDFSANLIPPIPSGGSGGGATTAFRDLFNGSAGSYAGHTPDVGTAAVITGSGVTAPQINGSGKLVFDATPGAISGVKITSALSSNRRHTLNVDSLAATTGVKLQSGMLNTSGGVTRRNFALEALDSSHVVATIQNSQTGAPIIQSTSIAVTFPLQWVMEYTGTQLKTSVNGVEVTTNDIGTDLTNYFDIIGFAGGVLNDVEILDL